MCSEQTSGKRFDEAKVKRLTGGDVLTGRFMRGDFFDFTPSHLTWVLSNHLPEVKEGGPSFWRRLRRIPFLHVVPEDKRDPEKHTKLLNAEGPAILGWSVLEKRCPPKRSDRTRVGQKSNRRLPDQRRQPGLVHQRIVCTQPAQPMPHHPVPRTLRETLRRGRG